jgi:hypothetical protein
MPSTLSLFSPAVLAGARGKTLIISIPALGDLGAMSLDVLLATQSAVRPVKRIGLGDSEALVPLSGYEDFGGSLGRCLCGPVEGGPAY